MGSKIKFSFHLWNAMPALFCLILTTFVFRRNPKQVVATNKHRKLLLSAPFVIKMLTMNSGMNINKTLSEGGGCLADRLQHLHHLLHVTSQVPMLSSSSSLPLLLSSSVFPPHYCHRRHHHRHPPHCNQTWSLLARSLPTSTSLHSINHFNWVLPRIKPPSSSSS